MTSRAHTLHRARRRRTAVVSVASAFVLTASLFTPGAASAAGSALVAPPNGASVGFVPNAVVITQGGTLDLIGADSTAHNVACAKKRRSGPKKRRRKPVCMSAFAVAGETQPVKGVDKLKPGTYELLCQLHPQMTAELTVL